MRRERGSRTNKPQRKEDGARRMDRREGAGRAGAGGRAKDLVVANFRDISFLLPFLASFLQGFLPLLCCRPLLSSVCLSPLDVSERRPGCRTTSFADITRKLNSFSLPLSLRPISPFILLFTPSSQWTSFSLFKRGGGRRGGGGGRVRTYLLPTIPPHSPSPPSPAILQPPLTAVRGSERQRW